MVAISGSGKSSLINSLLGFNFPIASVSGTGWVQDENSTLFSTNLLLYLLFPSACTSCIIEFAWNHESNDPRFEIEFLRLVKISPLWLFSLSIGDINVITTCCLFTFIQSWWMVKSDSNISRRCLRWSRRRVSFCSFLLSSLKPLPITHTYLL